MTKTTRRTLLERAKRIFNIINNNVENTFPSSDLYEAGLNSKSVNNWLDLITFIQDQPKIRVIKKRRGSEIERIGGRFSQMSLKYFLDENQPIEKRLKSLEAFAESIFVLERLGRTTDDKIR